MDKSFLPVLLLLVLLSAPARAQILTRGFLNSTDRQEYPPLDFRSFTNPFPAARQPSVPSLFHQRRCAFGDSLWCVSRDLAGDGAVNCGRVRFRTDPKRASSCVLKAFSEKRPFLVRYDLPGIDSEAARGLVGTADGRVIEIDWSTAAFSWPSYSENWNTHECVLPTLLETGVDGLLECRPLFDRLYRKNWPGIPGKEMKVNLKDWE